MNRKLLYINADVNWGSIGRITEQIGNLAMNAGWDCYIAYGRESNESRLGIYKVGNILSVYEHYFEHVIFDNDGLASRNATRSLVRFIKNLNPDIVHIHNVHDHWVNYEILFDTLSTQRIPIVWTQHDCWSITGGCMHFTMTKCDKWQSGCLKCPIKKSFLPFINKSALHFSKKKMLFSQPENLTIVPVSHWLESIIRKSFLSNKPIETICNGIDLDIFKPCAEKSKSIFKIIDVASAWSKSKGLYDFYKLRSLLPVEEYEILLVGLSKKQIKKLPAGIKGISRTDSVEQLTRLYSEANVLVNLTYADSFPTVNIESLACGTPVITYRTGGSPEIVDEKTGIIVEQGDIKGIARAIKRMKYSALSSDDCRERAVRLYNKNERFEDYLKLYDRLIKNIHNRQI